MIFCKLDSNLRLRLNHAQLILENLKKRLTRSSGARLSDSAAHEADAPTGPSQRASCAGILWRDAEATGTCNGLCGATERRFSSRRSRSNGPRSSFRYRFGASPTSCNMGGLCFPCREKVNELSTSAKAAALMNAAVCWKARTMGMGGGVARGAIGGGREEVGWGMLGVVSREGVGCSTWKLLQSDFFQLCSLWRSSVTVCCYVDVVLLRRILMLTDYTTSSVVVRCTIHSRPARVENIAYLRRDQLADNSSCCCCPWCC